MSELRVLADDALAERMRELVREALVNAGLTVRDDGDALSVSRPAPIPPPAPLFTEIARARAPAGAWTSAPPVAFAGEVGQVLGHLDDGATVWLVRGRDGMIGYCTTDARTAVPLGRGPCPGPEPVTLVDEPRRRWIMLTAAPESRR